MMSHIDDFQIAAYIDSDPSLSSAERKVIELHLFECARCGRVASEARLAAQQSKDFLAESGPRKLRAVDFADLERIATDRARRWRPSRSILAMAAVAVIAVSVGVYSSRFGISGTQSLTESERAAAVPAALEAPKQSDAVGDLDATPPPADRSLQRAADGALRSEARARRAAPVEQMTPAPRQAVVPQGEAAPPAALAPPAPPAPPAGDQGFGAQQEQQLAAAEGAPVAPPAPIAVEPAARLRERMAQRAVIAEDVDFEECDDPRAAFLRDSVGIRAESIPVFLDCATIVEVNETDTEFGPVHIVLQSLDDGRLVELIAIAWGTTDPLPSTADVRDIGRLTPSRFGMRVAAADPSRIILRAGDYAVIGTAMVPPEELRELLQRVVGR